MKKQTDMPKYEGGVVLGTSGQIVLTDQELDHRLDLIAELIIDRIFEDKKNGVLKFATMENNVVMKDKENSLQMYGTK